jgi:hypothetical protein
MFAVDNPTPLGKPILHSAFVDANLYHDLVNGKSVTGIMHLFNKTLIDWYTKKQSTVETGTYGSEWSQHTTQPWNRSLTYALNYAT